MSSSIILWPWWSCERSWTAWWTSRACPNRMPTWDFAASWKTLKVPPPSWSSWKCLSWKDGPAETPAHGQDTCMCTEILLPLWGLWVPRKILCWWAWSWNRCSSAPCMKCLPSHTTCNQITSNHAPMDLMSNWDTEIHIQAWILGVSEVCTWLHEQAPERWQRQAVNWRSWDPSYPARKWARGQRLDHQLFDWYYSFLWNWWRQPDRTVGCCWQRWCSWASCAVVCWVGRSF